MEKAKMLNGEFYDTRDPELRTLSSKAKDLMRVYNSPSAKNMNLRNHIIRSLLGSCGENIRVNQLIFVDYGCNVSLGSNSLINMNCTLLDTGKITIGESALLGPDVKIYTRSHCRLRKSLQINKNIRKRPVGGSFMPHIDITMIPGRRDAAKSEIAIKVQQFLSEELGINGRFVSVSIEDIEKEEWNAHMEKMKGKKTAGRIAKDCAVWLRFVTGLGGIIIETAQNYKNGYSHP